MNCQVCKKDKEVLLTDGDGNWMCQDCVVCSCKNNLEWNCEECDDCEPYTPYADK
jgi:hypothetical protein